MSNLELVNLTKKYGETTILNRISLTVRNGEFVSIVGPSGSGKSTLFRLIGGITSPNSGTIKLNGKEIIGKRGFISYMPQSDSLLPWRSILQNVVLAAEIAGRKDELEAKRMLERACLKGYENAYPHELSGGMKQRASFVRSILSPQPVICLDEPFSALDEFTRLDMQKWLLAMWNEHQRSILFVTHNIEEALFLSDRVIVLSARPASIKKEFTIPFSRPREEALVLSEAFLEYKKRIYQELRATNG
ncbi:ABC transporter ATP-binding protein [Virgibacillus salarius]|uniref:ABC transporter ATP-binding protein n=1 Tax=Virgibacillus salarius TaxID=447199 RepID=UPI0031DAC3E9